MLSIASLFALIGSATAVAVPRQTAGLPGCGEVDIFFTGLPPYHPLVTQQGFDPAQVDAALRADARHIVEAGYNLRVSLAGPEQDLSVLRGRMQDTEWDGTGIGYGVRGSRLPDLTVRFEDEIQLFRDEAPDAPIVFNYSPDSGLWAIQRRFPLSQNCTGSPGTDLGFEIFCDICE